MLRRDSIAPRRTVLGILAASLMLLVFAGSAFAQALDAPTLKLDRAGFFRIDFDVQAGPSGAPNGFSIQWMKKGTYLSIGGFPNTLEDPAASSCDFTGTPSLNPDTRSTTFELAPNGVIQVQMGDLADESGLTSINDLPQLAPGDYVFRVWANGDGTPGSGSDLSEPVFASTTNPECTQGFWQNHPDNWPAGCLPMTIGTVAYTKAQLLAIYAEPVSGNGLISLAHQLTAVKLNIASGAIAPAMTLAAVAAADAMIGNLVVPPIGSGFLSPATTSNLNDILEAFNAEEGKGTIQCQGQTASHVHTWGDLKSLYR